MKWLIARIACALWSHRRYGVVEMDGTGVIYCGRCGKQWIRQRERWS